MEHSTLHPRQRTLLFACYVSWHILFVNAHVDFNCCCYAIFGLDIEIHQQQSIGKSEAVVRCTRSSAEASRQQVCTYEYLPRCVSHVGRYAPGTLLLAPLCSVCMQFWHCQPRHSSGSDYFLLCKRINDMCVVCRNIVRSTDIKPPLLYTPGREE